MRILGTFDIAGVCRTVPGAGYKNICKFIANLVRHGYVAKTGDYTGGRPGEFQTYRLVKNTGPEYPLVCDRCGQVITARVCDPALFLTPEKEKEKEKETKRKRKKAAPAAHKPVAAAEGGGL